MYKDKKIVAVITARGGSKGIPYKNIKELYGKPLIAWTIEAALDSEYIDRVCVNTDDEKIAEVSKKHGAEIPFIRSSELASDTASTRDVILDFMKRIDDKYDYLILLQPTSPLRMTKDIDLAIESILENDRISLISVNEPEFPPNYIRKIVDGRMEKAFSYDAKNQHRRQDYEKFYRLNGAIYITKWETYEESGFENEDTYPFLMDQISSVDIDEPKDLELAEYYFKKRYGNV